MTRRLAALVRTFAAAAAFALPSASALSAPPAPADSSSVITESGFTKPWERAEMTMQTYGLIADIPVKRGETVKKGDVLLQQDDRADQKALEALQLEADSTVRIEASKADLEVKKVQLARVQDLYKSGGSNNIELEDAKTKVVYADATAKVSELDNAKNKLDADRQRIKVEQMKLLSPLDGIVERIDAAVGEITDPQKSMVTVVQINPLKVQLHVPTALASKLKTNDGLDVRYVNDGAADWKQAKVIYVAPVAEADADRCEITLELPNPEGRMAGLWVSVKIPEALAAQPASAVEKADVNARANQ
jgi:RND family efflux transporter MFP subunit